MKNPFIIAVIVLLFAGCATKSDIEELQKQIDDLMNTQIATTDMQIANIQKSIGDLSEVDKMLNGLIAGLREDLEGLNEGVDVKYQEINEALDDLEREDAALDQRIKTLKTYCDEQDEGVKNWAAVTFATLEQHSAVLTEIASIKTRLGEITQMISNLDTTLSQKITDAEGRLMAAIGRSENSVKTWVNEKLADYYTIAQIEAKLKALEDGYSEGDEALSTEIMTLRSNLETAKTDLTTAYQTAIATAIEQNNGFINNKIAADIKTASDALQIQIDEINGRLDSIESRLSSLEASVAKLIKMIQSIVVVPDYLDGSVKISPVEDNKVRFEIYPLESAEAIAQAGPSILSMDYVETLTKSSEELVNLPITEVSFTGKTLLVTVDGTNLPNTIIEGSKAASARLMISDGTNTRSSEYFPIHKNECQIAITGESDEIDDSSATLYGWSNQEGSDAVSIVFGIEYSSTDLTTAAISVTASEKDDENKYSCRITGLTYNTLYYYRAFTLYNGVREYGEVKNFKTLYILVSSITLDKTSLSLEVGDEATIFVTSILPDNANDKSYTWSSSDTSVASVDQNGKVIAVSNGDAVISATANDGSGKKATCTVTVTTMVTGITLNKSTLSLNDGASETLTVTISPSTASDKSVTWSSTDTSVATVDQNGKVTAVGNGNAVISATANDGSDKKATCTVTVTTLVTGITLNKSTLSLNEGSNETLTITISPSTASDKSVTWSSTDTSVATVDQNGKVTAVSKGTATIKASTNDGSGLSASCSVTVIKPVSSIQLNKTSLVLYRGASDVTETLTVSVIPSDASDTPFTWLSSNVSVAAVSSSGVVTGKSKGTATITVSANDGSGASSTCEVEVKQYVTSISLNPTSLILNKDEEQTLTPTVIPSNASDKSLNWTSSNESVAIVDNNGKVTAKSLGSAIIKVMANDGSDKMATCSVTVTKKVPTGAVDLGLSVFWASCNLGTNGFVSSPKEYGAYYAWGETEPKSYYDWSTYKYGNYNNKYIITKYNTKTSYGTVDNKTTLDLGDDAAHVKLGGNWRLPTKEEWTELKTKCTSTWTTQNGVKGRKYTGPNGNSIFLPAAEYRHQDSVPEEYWSGFYWSSSLYTGGEPNHAWGWNFNEGNVGGTYEFDRADGQSIRPVSE